MMLRIGEAHEQAPPIVDQRHTARQQPAAFEIMRGEAAPPPLVLQLVERTTGDCVSGGVESNGRFELPAMQVMSHRFTEDEIPPPERIQLLRTLPQLGHEAGDPQISAACQMLLAVGAAHRQPHLAGMMGSPRQGSEQ
jgi:hypothetical protein